jgi:hypothetical protein
MIQEGKLEGLGGLSNLYRTKMSTPSNYQRKLGSIGGTMDIIGKVGGAVMGAYGGGGKSVIPSSRINVPGMYGAY